MGVVRHASYGQLFFTRLQRSLAVAYPRPLRYLRLNLRLNRHEFEKVLRAARLAGEAPGTFARNSLVKAADRFISRQTLPKGSHNHV